jgi:hypothetical protein
MWARSTVRFGSLMHTPQPAYDAGALANGVATMSVPTLGDNTTTRSTTWLSAITGRLMALSRVACCRRRGG